MKAIFKDRKEAGKKLAAMLSEYKGKNTIVLGVPKGGAEVAFQVAKDLHADFSLALSMKLPFAGYEEYGFGALCEDDIVYLAHVPPALNAELLTELVNIKKMEIEKLVKKLRNNQPLPLLEGRIVILVDDGIANGTTMVPLVRMCKKKKAAKVIVAAPVSCREYDRGLREADRIIVNQRPAGFHSVEKCYEDFTEPTDEEIQSFLNENIIKQNEEYR